MLVFSKLTKLLYNNIKIIFISFILYNLTSSLSSNNYEKTVSLYAPISLSEVIKEVIDSFEILKSEIHINSIFMGTSQLVMQLKNGARPDIFISANEEWMDYVERKKIILRKYRKNYLHNSLVVITNKKNNIGTINNISELEDVFLKSKTKISLAMTSSIPAGMYAKDFLENTGIWKKIKKKYVESTNVRAALNYVARNDLQFAIVYKTEALGSNKVKIVYLIDHQKHKKITYPIATLNDKKETLEVYDFLLDKKSLSKTLKWGFEYSND